MRGKTALLVFHVQAEGEERYDDLGRRQQVADEGVEVRGAVNPPRRLYRGEPVVTDFDAVAFIPVGKVEVADGMWVEVTEARSPLQLGSYSIESVAGGLRVMRLDLKRIERRDGSHGPL